MLFRSDGYWQVQVVAVRIGNTTLGLCADGSCRAILDTGTSLLTFPKALHAALLLEIEMGCKETDCLLKLQQQETCNCTAMASLPDIQLTIGNQPVSLSPSTYMGEMMVRTTKDLGKMGPFEIIAKGVGKRCIPLFSAMDSQTNLGYLVILGMPFFREYAVRFDRPGRGMSVAKIPPGSKIGRASCRERV